MHTSKLTEQSVLQKSEESIIMHVGCTVEEVKGSGARADDLEGIVCSPLGQQVIAWPVSLLLHCLGE